VRLAWSRRLVSEARPGNAGALSFERLKRGEIRPTLHRSTKILISAVVSTPARRATARQWWVPQPTRHREGIRNRPCDRLLRRLDPPRNRSSMLRSAYPPGGDPLDFPDTPQGACGRGCGSRNHHLRRRSGQRQWNGRDDQWRQGRRGLQRVSTRWASLSQAWAMPTSNILHSGLIVFSSAMHKHCTARRRYSLMAMSCTPRRLQERPEPSSCP
jgi:hypothetical protein